MKNTIVSIALILVSLLVLFLFFSRDAQITNFPPKEGPIVAFGDSLVKGIGADEDQNFVALLSKKIGEPIINLGVPGDTTADGLLRVDSVLAEEPRIVILLLGGNDYLKRLSKEDTFLNLEKMITTFQDAGAIVVLLGVRGGLLNDHFNDGFEELAEKNGVVFVPNVLDGIFGKSTLMSDAVHPNKDGYAIIADKVYEEMEGVLR